MLHCYSSSMWCRDHCLDTVGGQLALWADSQLMMGWEGDPGTRPFHMHQQVV